MLISVFTNTLLKSKDAYC